jgi:hypothetical protein
LRYVAELRDPIVGYYRSRHSLIVNRVIEKVVTQTADRIIEWEDFTPEPVHCRNPDLLRKLTLIPNVGYDPEEYSAPVNLKEFDRLRLVYTGGYYGEIAIWKLFFQALIPSMEKNGAIYFEHYGDWSPEQAELIQHVKGEIGRRIRIHHRKPKHECIQACRQASLLLYTLEINRENKMRVSSKIYDYIAARKPILAIVPEESRSAQKLKHSDSHFVFDLPDDWIEQKSDYQLKFEELFCAILRKHYNGGLRYDGNRNLLDYSCQKSQNQFVQAILKS